MQGEEVRQHRWGKWRKSVCLNCGISRCQHADVQTEEGTMRLLWRLLKCPACGYYAFNGIECFDCGYRR